MPACMCYRSCRGCRGSAWACSVLPSASRPLAAPHVPPCHCCPPPCTCLASPAHPLCCDPRPQPAGQCRLALLAQAAGAAGPVRRGAAGRRQQQQPAAGRPAPGRSGRGASGGRPHDAAPLAAGHVRGEGGGAGAVLLLLWGLLLLALQSAPCSAADCWLIHLAGELLWCVSRQAGGWLDLQRVGCAAVVTLCCHPPICCCGGIVLPPMCCSA